MNDDLVKRPVLRIYTEATSGNGGLWAFAPYKSVHTVFVEESNYRDLEYRIEALIAQLAEDADARTQIDRRLEELVGQVDALTAERDRAIDDARDNAEYVDLVSQFRAERDEYKRNAAHSEDVVEAAKAEIERLKQEVDQFRRVNDGLQDAMLAAEADNARLTAIIATMKMYMAGEPSNPPVTGVPKVDIAAFTGKETK